MEENKKLNDEELKNAVGGSGFRQKPYYTGEATIIGPVLQDPGRTNPRFAGQWEYIVKRGESVYAISYTEDSYAAYATVSNKSIFQAGDRVYINAIRGDYGYEIVGLVSDYE